MFDFLEARIATMLRTSRSLLRMARRHLMRDLRSEEEIQKKLLPALQDAGKRGDVDLVMKEFLDDEKKLFKILDDLDDIERNTFIAEYRSVDQVADLQHGFEVELKLLEELMRNNPLIRASLEKVFAQMKRLQEALHHDADLELNELHNQYLAVAREKGGESLQLQTFVFALSGVMKAMDELWNLRGEIRKERREGKDILKQEGAVLHILKQLGEVSHNLTVTDPRRKELLIKQQALLLQQLQKVEHTIETEFPKYERLFKQAEVAFTLVMKVCVDIYFQFVKDQESFEAFMKMLKTTGFPQSDFEKLVQIVEKAKSTQTAEIDALLDVVRRGSRLQGGRLAS